MSWKATAYVKELHQAPNGQKITCSEKLIMFVLADCFNEDYQLAWPSIPRLASASLMTERHASRVLRALEAKGLVQVIRKHGLGNTNGYRFPGHSKPVTKCTPDKMSGLPVSNTGQVPLRSPTLEHLKQDVAMSGEPKETETQNMNEDPEGRAFYARELKEMRRHGSIGRTTRNVYRMQLENPAESASLPEWFRREAEGILRSYKETSSDSSSTRVQRD